MKLITIDHYQVHMTPMTLRRSLGQRSRSASSGHRNLVNLIATKPLEGFEQKLTQIQLGHKLITSLRSCVQR